MSTRMQPSSFSSGVRVASELASCWRTMSRTSSPALLAHLMMFCAEATAPVTMWTSASRRVPVIPSGSRMPPWSSIMNSCGRTWITSRSTGRATALAASMTRSMSWRVTSRFLPAMAMTPRLLIPLMWPPAIPTKADRISTPAISSASSTARRMESTVASMLTTTPLRSPRDGLWPRPMTSTTPLPFFSATMAQTFVVPMSRPTITPLSLPIPITSLCVPAGRPRLLFPWLHPRPLPARRHHGRAVVPPASLKITRSRKRRSTSPNRSRAWPLADSAAPSRPSCPSMSWARNRIAGIRCPRFTT